MAVFEDFYRGVLLLHSLNFGTINLPQKNSDIKQIYQYRPKCWLNVSFKMFTKVANNRIMLVAQKIICLI